MNLIQDKNLLQDWSTTLGSLFKSMTEPSFKLLIDSIAY